MRAMGPRGMESVSMTQPTICLMPWRRAVARLALLAFTLLVAVAAFVSPEVGCRGRSAGGACFSRDAAQAC